MITSKQCTLNLPRHSYIGADGNLYRFLVPIRSIILKQVEHNQKGAQEWTFLGPRSFLSANSQLFYNSISIRNQDQGFKHDFLVTWADGYTYRGTFTLTKKDVIPDIIDHMRNYLYGLLYNSADICHITDKMRAEIKKVLQTRYIGQGAVPEDTPSHIVHDFRDTSNHIDFWNLQSEVFKDYMIAA